MKTVEEKGEQLLRVMLLIAGELRRNLGNDAFEFTRLRRAVRTTLK